MTSAADHGLELSDVERALDYTDPDEVFDHLIRNYSGRWVTYSEFKRARRLARIVGRHWEMHEADVLDAALEMFREWEYAVALGGVE